MARVLVIDDEASFSDALSYLLAKAGFDVAVASSGPQGLEEFGRTGADIVLLDLMLPGLGGADVCRRLREDSQVPIIMLTARECEADRVASLRTGANDYVTKPFSARDLLNRIRRLTAT